MTSAWNGKNIITWPDRDGAPLTASTSVVAEWKTFTVNEAGHGGVALRSAGNGAFVSVDTASADAPLKASATMVGVNEKFRWIAREDGKLALRAEGNGKFVSVCGAVEQAPLRATVAHKWHPVEAVLLRLSCAREAISVRSPVIRAADGPSPAEPRPAQVCRRRQPPRLTGHAEAAPSSAIGPPTAAGSAGTVMPKRASRPVRYASWAPARA